MCRKIILYIVAICMLCLVFVSGCASDASSSAQSGGKMVSAITNSDQALHVTMLNVGQADAALIQYKGKNMLIDTGDVDSRDELVQMLKERDVKTLDVIVVTHPHGDHMGGMAALFKAFPIKQIYDNGQAANTAMYRNYLKNIKNKQIPYKTLKKGDTITLGDDVKFAVLSPGQPFTKENTQGVSESGLTNDNSIVCKMTYGDFSIMFTGDAQKEVEETLLRDYKKRELQADVLKVGHHGSKTSSSAAFVKAVHPAVATISCGVNNQYKFPHKQAMDALQQVNAEIYRTDKNGSIMLVSDGTSYSVAKERE